MRDRFPGYYRPNPAEFQQLWPQATFVFDTNVLLNLYRYGSLTRDALLTVLTRLRGRIWIPHRVGMEYHRRRAKVVSDQRKVYDDLIKNLEGMKGQLNDLRNQYRNRHPYIDGETLFPPVEAQLQSAIDALERLALQHPSNLHDDSIRDKLAELFAGDACGGPFSPDTTVEMEKWADDRLSREVPPGYADVSRKTDLDDRRGDVFVWRQTLDYAASTKRPIIFVTGDVKDDWWLRQDGQILGPRPELVDEMRRVAGTQFYMYSPDRFIQEAQQYLNVATKAEVIEEVRELQEHDERAAATARQLRRLPSRHIHDLRHFDSAELRELAQQLHQKALVERLSDEDRLLMREIQLERTQRGYLRRSSRYRSTTQPDESLGEPVGQLTRSQLPGMSLTRSLIAPDGAPWGAHLRTVLAETGHPRLVLEFFNGADYRHLSPVPEDWASLSDTDLASLWELAQPKG